MITIQLTKLESALDQVRKTYPKLKPADSALIASALTLTGRHAYALFEGKKYAWPDENADLIKAVLPLVNFSEEATEPVKKTAKSTTEEEPIHVSIGLTPNLSAGEGLLQTRDDLKSLLAEILKDGVEYSYVSSDIGWQWALDRANWSTAAGKELHRKVKVKTEFTEGASGIDMSAATTKKRTPKAKIEAPVVVEPVADPVETE